MTRTDPRETPEQREWLAQQFEALTTELTILSPSAWAEQKRYLPPSLTSMPGYYRFEVAPYLREIIDCLSVDSPIREVSLMKGAQVCATVGIFENAIGYYIDHVKTAPVMLVTADLELAKIRLDTNIVPMLRFSGLEHLIQSADEGNNRKTGKTEKKVEWNGGGYLLPQGANNANKMRSFSIRILLRDEVDGWPLIVGRDGDPMALTKARTNGYESSRKIADLSTPTIKGQSQIEARFKAGDQRYYFVCCLGCGHPQRLRWTGVNDQGEVYGIVWEMDGDRLIPDSVRYLCEKCGHAHTNDDKTRLLSPANGAEWRPTATPSHPDHRSYHLSALYSPVGMQTWAGCVALYLEAWDTKTNKVKDHEKLQVFYNNVLGASFEIIGDRVKFVQVSPHRRPEYRFGTVPNAFAAEHCGSEILLLTCAVDVHKESLKVAVFGWTRGRRAFLVYYETFEGSTENGDEPETWGRLATLIAEGLFHSDDDRKHYPIILTLIDSGYAADTVYRFCHGRAGCYPLKGRDENPSGASAREFAPFDTTSGVQGFLVTVNFYKDRWSAALKQQWDGQSRQLPGHFNAPSDTTDAQLEELTKETKRAKINPQTGKRTGWVWHRPSGSKNELWDLLVYNSAALDILAWLVCRQHFEQEQINWSWFFDALEQQLLNTYRIG